VPWEAATAATSAVMRFLPALPVAGGAWFTYLVAASTGAGAFLGALATGALGFAGHAYVSRFRR